MKRAGGVAQGVDPEFKPQHHQKKKEGQSDTRYNTGEPWGHIVRKINPITKDCLAHSREVPGGARLMETEVAGHQGGGWMVSLHGDRVSVWEGGKLWACLMVTAVRQWERLSHCTGHVK
jgi:hypothetical protein